MDVTSVLIVAIIFGSILIGLFIISSLLGKVLGSRGRGRLSDEESQIMQEIFYCVRTYVLLLLADVSMVNRE